MITQEDFIIQAEAELVDAGFIPLKTAVQVDHHFQDHQGITLLVVNSMCGCAGSGARMGAIEALHTSGGFLKVDYAVTVFPGVNEEATEALQAYLQPYPLSSPMIAIIQDGAVVHCLERHQIKGYPVAEIAEAVQHGIALTTA